MLPWLGLIVGVGMALAGVQKYAPSPLNDSEIARVNGVSIQKNEWLRAIDAANSGRRSALDPAAEQRILNTLINEELLLQMALSLGLEHGIPEVRGRLVQAAMDALADTGATEPSAEDLQSFVASNPTLFAQPERRQTRVRRFASAEAAARNSDGTLMDVPEDPLSLRQLQRWVGNTVASAAFAAEPIAASSPGDLPMLAPPIAVGQAWYRVEVLAIEPAYRPEARDIPRAQLVRAWQRERSEQALADALEELRAGADISTALPKSP